MDMVWVFIKALFLVYAVYSLVIWLVRPFNKKYLYTHDTHCVFRARIYVIKHIFTGIINGMVFMFIVSTRQNRGVIDNQFLLYTYGYCVFLGLVYGLLYEEDRYNKKFSFKNLFAKFKRKKD